VLALKLVLVPGFLAALTMAGRVWGPSVAGWLAGLPVVAGPIVLLLALERGTAFAAQASAASIAAIAASEAFNFAYAWTSRFARWPVALVAGLVAWALVAVLLTHLPVSLAWSLAAACVAVAVSQAGLPRVEGAVPAARVVRGVLLGCRADDADAWRPARVRMRRGRVGARAGRDEAAGRDVAQAARAAGRARLRFFRNA
jgi:hypothetical protein